MMARDVEEALHSGSNHDLPRRTSEQRSSSIESAPSSHSYNNSIIPLHNNPTSQKPGTQHPDPVLIHSSLNKLPVQVRYGLTGFLTNALFMIFYNSAVAYFKHTYSLSTIYCAVYILFIPVSHAAISLLCFGWPELYLISLLSNYPIGLTAMAMGAALTSYLDRAEFNGKIEELTHRIFPFLDGSGRLLEARKDKSEFYSSFLVLIVTGVWTYVLSVYVNTPPATSEKKEL